MKIGEPMISVNRCLLREFDDSFRKTHKFPLSIGEKLRKSAICQEVIEKKMGTTSLLVRKRGDNQLECWFSLGFDNSSSSFNVLFGLKTLNIKGKVILS